MSNQQHLVASILLIDKALNNIFSINISTLSIEHRYQVAEIAGAITLITDAKNVLDNILQ